MEKRGKGIELLWHIPIIICCPNGHRAKNEIGVKNSKMDTVKMAELKFILNKIFLF
jgi:hypothetical protein